MLLALYVGKRGPYLWLYLVVRCIANAYISTLPVLVAYIWFRILSSHLKLTRRKIFGACIGHLRGENQFWPELNISSLCYFVQSLLKYVRYNCRVKRYVYECAWLVIVPWANLIELAVFSSFQQLVSGPGLISLWLAPILRPILNSLQFRLGLRCFLTLRVINWVRL